METEILKNCIKACDVARLFEAVFRGTLQDRLVKSHGIQCGFCTPGMIMSLYALLRNHAQPSQQQVEHALQGINPTHSPVILPTFSHRLDYTHFCTMTFWSMVQIRQFGTAVSKGLVGNRQTHSSPLYYCLYFFSSKKAYRILVRNI